MTVGALAVIPARYDSVRFPGKPLADLAGKPMIQWVYEAAAASGVFASVVVATDDNRIAAVVAGFGGEAVMTSTSHASGTDRVAEVARAHPEHDVVVNVQGDQPFVRADDLTRLLGPYLAGDTPPMATVACPIVADGVYGDPNAVKVVCDRTMNALYFSRSPIPFFRQRHEAPVFHHIGLYAFTADFVQEFARMEPTPLERCEQLEQLRALENGHRIRVSVVDRPIHEVNTEADLVAARELVAAGEIG